MSLWPTKALSGLGTVVTGSTPRTSEEHFFGGNIPFVTPADLDQSPPIIETSRTLTEAGSNEIRMLPSGAVLVCCIGSLGKTGIAGIPLATNQQINSIIFDQKQILPQYGFYACQRLKSKLEMMAPATTVAIVSKSKFERLEIPVPPLDEQNRIVEILDQADELRQKRRLTLEGLDALNMATFYSLFGDPSASDSKWPLAKLGELLSETQYGTSAKAGSVGEVPILRMNNVTYNGEIDISDLKFIDLTAREIKKYTVKDGDLVFNRTNSPELVGKTAVIRGCDGMAFAGYLVRLRVNDHAVPEYISAIMNSPFGKRTLRGMAKSIIGMANINAKEVQRIAIPRPPIELQRKFSDHVAEIREVRKLQRAHLSKLDALFASLQHRAFNGELTQSYAEAELAMAG